MTNVVVALKTYLETIVVMLCIKAFKLMFNLVTYLSTPRKINYTLKHFSEPSLFI